VSSICEEDVLRFLDLHTDSAPIEYLKSEFKKLKQPKTPKWFVADLSKKYKQVEYLHQIEEHDLVYKFTIGDDGKTYLVGTYLYE
jgi:hypothetical protein